MEIRNDVKTIPIQKSDKNSAEDTTFGLVEEFKPRIGKEEIKKANQTLENYKKGKANLENQIVENEQWYKLRHWDYLSNKENKKGSVDPVSAWLFNNIANKHADAMDSFPAPNILPREETDKQEAKMLSSIVPVILEQNDYETTYSDVWNDKLKNGTGIYGCFWNSSKLNGLGDIDIRDIDILNLFWEPGIKDIQKSRNIFHIELVDNDVLSDTYPQLKGKLGTATFNVKSYVYDDTVDTSEKSVVVDWYYKKYSGGKTLLHYVKYVNDDVLFATENDPDFVDRGFYDHGLYPFVFDVLFPVKGTPAGFGYVNIAKSPQEYIDRLDKSILQNAFANTKPRFFIRDDGSVNESEYADFTNDFVHVKGSISEGSIAPILGTGLSSIYVDIRNNKIEELKETTGNRDVSTGGTGGVTAAAAIAAMQEAGSKLSRDANRKSYGVHRKLILMVIELIRQFYNHSRCFRIIGENGAEEYVRYMNKGIVLQSQGTEMGVDMGYRLPLFDVEVTAQKQSPYSKLSQNELALQLFNAGFFNPQIADQALACLDMMDFDRKQFIMQKISQNGTLYQQLITLQQQTVAFAHMVDQSRGTNFAQQLLGQFQGRYIPPVASNMSVNTDINDSQALGGKGNGESSVTENARKRVAESTSPT